MEESAGLWRTRKGVEGHSCAVGSTSQPGRTCRFRCGSWQRGGRCGPGAICSSRPTTSRPRIEAARRRSATGYRAATAHDHATRVQVARQGPGNRVDLHAPALPPLPGLSHLDARPPRDVARRDPRVDLIAPRARVFRAGGRRPHLRRPSPALVLVSTSLVMVREIGLGRSGRNHRSGHGGRRLGGAFRAFPALPQGAAALHLLLRLRVHRDGTQLRARLAPAVPVLRALPPLSNPLRCPGRRAWSAAYC